MTEPFIAVSGLTVTFPGPAGPVQALSRIDLELRGGRIFGLVGESGCGKSTIGRVLLGILPATAEVRGDVTIGGHRFRLTGATPRPGYLGGSVAMVDQDPASSLNPVLRLETQLGHVLRARARGLSRTAWRNRARELLTAVKLDPPESFLPRFPHELSGGQAQRAALALALATDPALVVADEPTTALDIVTQSHILDLVRELAATRNTAFLWISHDLSLLKSFADRIGVLYAGVLVEGGKTTAVLEAPRHPYSAALLAAVPEPGRRTLRGLPGEPGNSPPAGCPFVPRCRYAQAHCREEYPPFEGDEDHWWRCFHPLEPGAHHHIPRYRNAAPFAITSQGE